MTVLHAKDAVLRVGADAALRLRIVRFCDVLGVFAACIQPGGSQFVYAIAHIRGGTENGCGWYLDGKLDRKKNTFLDFISVAEYLIAENFTSASGSWRRGVAPAVC